MHSRREFLSATLAAACAGAAGAAEKGKDAVFPIVDTHQHLWDLTKFRLPWLKNQAKLNRSYLPEDYRQATADLGVFEAAGEENVPKGKIVQAVYMEVDLAPEQQVGEAEYVIDLCRQGKGPTVAGVISGRPASDGFKNYLTPFKGSPYIKGVRQVLHGDDTPAGYCLQPEFIKGVQLLGELGMSFDLCLRPGELLDGAKLIDVCPDTRFILDHCGNANVQAKDRSQWQRDIAAVAKRKQVVGKVSGIVASAKPGHWTANDLAPIVQHTLEVFGPDRVLFGGDWPVCTLAATYKQWVEALKSIVKGRSLQEQRKLFHDNAVRFYGLKHGV